MVHTDILTICIPVYERYDFFEEAIDSAMKQSVSCKIIVSDNGSSHDKFKIYCEDRGIEYHRNNENIGMFPNWNKCFNYAKTPFVMIFGDDDILKSNFVEEFLKINNEFNDLDFYYTNVDTLTNGNEEEWEYPATYGFFDKSLELLEFAAREGAGLPSISGVFKRAYMLDKPLPDSFHGSNDFLWLYSNIDSMKIYGNKQRLLLYRRHANQDSSSNNFVSYYWSYPVIYYIIYEKLAGRSNFAQRALARAMSLALQSLTMFEYRFVSYYQSANNNDVYKFYYKNKLALHSLPIKIMVAQKSLSYLGLRFYFKFNNLLKTKFLIP